MADYNKTNHLLIWDKKTDRPVKIDYPHLAFFGNLLAAPKLWSVDASKSITKNLVSGLENKGQFTANDVFVCGFLITKGDIGGALKLAQVVDLNFLSNYTLDTEAKAHVDAYSTLTFAPVVGADATTIILWARNNAGATAIPDIPIGLVMDFINAYNVWARSIKDRGELLDSGRINVRFDAYHVEGGAVHTGRKTQGRLTALGTYPNEGMAAEDAWAASGMDRAQYLLEIARSNGWWAASSDTPAYADEPRNAIIL